MNPILAFICKQEDQIYKNANYVTVECQGNTIDIVCGHPGYLQREHSVEGELNIFLKLLNSYALPEFINTFSIKQPGDLDVISPEMCLQLWMAGEFYIECKLVILDPVYTGFSAAVYFQKEGNALSVFSDVSHEKEQIEYFDEPGKFIEYTRSLSSPEQQQLSIITLRKEKE